MNDSSSTSSGRWLPATWWGRILLALPLFGILFLRFFDVTGDVGMTNAFTMMLAGPFVIFWLLWFLAASGHPWRKRLGGIAVLAASVAIFLAFSASTG